MPRVSASLIPSSTGLMNSSRNRPAAGLVLEDVSRAGLARKEVDLDVAVLAAAAGLLGVLHLAIGGPRQRFLVGHLRTADGGLDAELALEAVDDDLEVQLAHAGDDDFAGLLIGLDPERRVFGHQLLHARAELFLVGLGLRLDGERDDRLREVHRLEDDRLLLVAHRVAGRDRLQADGRGDVAGVDFLDFLALVRVHLQQAAEALGLLLGRVVDRRAGGHDARVDANERELADERVGHDLERQRRKRRVVGRRTLDDGFGPLVRIEALDRRHVDRRRQVVDDRVEQRLHALVLERRPADDRHEGGLRLRRPRCARSC